MRSRILLVLYGPSPIRPLNFQGNSPRSRLITRPVARSAGGFVMFIQTEATPNPATLKVLPGRQVLDNGTLEIRDADQAAQSPLAERLFGILGASGVFL